MKVKNICVYNMYPAILGIRNSYKSKDKSDSEKLNMDGFVYGVAYNHCNIGEEDKKLIEKLVNRSDEYGHQERKFLRQILVSMDIVGSIKFWAQMDTFKVATVRNSESTMHSITKGEVTQNDFEREINQEQINYVNKLIMIFNDIKSKSIEEFAVYLSINDALFDKENLLYKVSRELDVEKMKVYLFELIDANLPGGYLLESHWTANYEVLRNIYHGRRNHKMFYWSQFCEYIKKLPYFDLLIKG